MYGTGQFMEVAETGSPEDIFRQLDRLVQETMGAIIFTCSTFDASTRMARRVYTNQSEAYPTSGLKEITPNPWTEIVLDRGETFVANSISQIAKVFPDHELIASLGCGSVVNLPVKLASRFLGTVNMLHEPEFYTEERMTRLSMIKPAAMIAFAALNMDDRSGIISGAEKRQAQPQ